MEEEATQSRSLPHLQISPDPSQTVQLTVIINTTATTISTTNTTTAKIIFKRHTSLPKGITDICFPGSTKMYIIHNTYHCT